MPFPKAPHRIPTRTSACLLTLALGLSPLVGCGGQDGTPSPSPTPTEAVNPTPTPTATAVPTPTSAPACTTDLDGDGFVSDACLGGTDCDDQNASVYPSAAEGQDNGTGTLQGDFTDNDCDDKVDEGTNQYDDDGDGFSDLEGDCNDRAPGISPDAAEVCDGIDNDCDGAIDNKDTDKDGYIAATCTGGDDCNDVNPAQYPGAPEGTAGAGGVLISDGVDNDCDSVIDEDTNTSDDDGDGLSEAQGDCDDEDVLVNPNAPERFDAKDQNCDGALTFPSTADAAPASAVGVLPGGQAGFSIDGVGDVNGDGYGDLLIGAPYHDPEAKRTGAAFLLAGRRLGWDEDMDLAEETLFAPQNAAGARAGWSVAGAGDMTGDGVPDFAIGAPGLTYQNNSQAGGIYVYPGQGVPWEDQILGQQSAFGGTNSYGLSAEVEFGYSLAGAGGGRGCDANGDGYPDLLIGGPWDVATPGINAKGYLMFLPGGVLPPAATLFDLVSWSGGSGQALGYNVACGGDYNGVAESTGTYPDDMFVAGKGDSTSTGAITLVTGSIDYQSPGPKGPISQAATATWSGTSGGQWLGRRMAGLGDTNGDGLSDVAIGMLQRSADQPLAYVLYGGGTAGGSLDSGAALLVTGESDELCPCGVAGVGDFNGDGWGDMVVSATGAPSADGLAARAGRIFLFFGGSEGFGAAGTLLPTSAADFTFSGTAAQSSFGQSLAAAGDLNGDGFADFVVGAPEMPVDLAGASQDEVGKVYIFFGFDTSLLP